ncbi:MAG: vanadium-dependent haloperoxidase [Myxococcota bacterium]
MAVVAFATPDLAKAQYDFDNGNAAFEIAIQAVAPVIFEEFSETAGDATLVLRATLFTTNAWYDASAPYHPTAVGVYSRLGRRPASESATNRNINIALLYATYRVNVSLFPNREADFRAMLENVGLDPDDDSTDLTSPIGIGNVAGNSIIEGRLFDGMNQLGTDGGRDFNPMPYADTTGYRPVNTPYRLFAPSRWQPDIQRKGAGIYRSQVFVTPQYALLEAYSYDDQRDFSFPPPVNSQVWRWRRYRRQAREVLQASADLTEDQKLKAELFDNKITSLGFSAVFAGLSQGLPLLEFIQLDFLTNVAAFDAGIVVWQEKRKFDAVRPFSAIKLIYGDRLVEAYGGPGVGTTTLPASQWKSYLEEADHPEYPSATTCFCAAHTQSARRFLGNDTLGFPTEFPAGSSRAEPGLTPADDTVIVFDTWTEFNDDCGQSRVWAGVHFQAAVDESKALCNVFGDLAYEYVQTLIDGTAPEREPARPKNFKTKYKY